MLIPTILCGGSGKRLHPIRTPKPVLPYPERRSLLCETITTLAAEGLTQMFLLCSHRTQDVLKVVLAECPGVEFWILHEPEATGTAGALRKATHWFGSLDRMLLVYGDVWMAPFMWKELILRERTDPGYYGRWVVTDLDLPGQRGVLDLREDGSIHSFVEKPVVCDGHPVRFGGIATLPANFLWEFLSGPEAIGPDVGRDIFSAIGPPWFAPHGIETFHVPLDALQDIGDLGATYWL